VAYSILLDFPDGWVDRVKVKERLDGVLASATGEATPEQEAGMLALAGFVG